MLLSAVSVLVLGQPSSEFSEGLINYPVLRHSYTHFVTSSPPFNKTKWQERNKMSAEIHSQSSSVQNVLWTSR
jgi:hypothetical protein